MATQPLYTNEQFRLQCIKTCPGVVQNWLWLPGGPGLGSESLLPCTSQLSLPGVTWHVDYPGDGSNKISSAINYENWSSGLINLVDAMDQVILVAHSFSGMWVLSHPQLESRITGLVLLNTAPSQEWMAHIPKQAQQYGLPDTSALQQQYVEYPNNEYFKALTLACAPYFFAEASLALGRQLLESLPYQHAPYDWAAQHFHPHYQAKWIPQKIPTLIIGAEQDHITPLDLFKNDQRFARNNIEIECIAKAGHFPWFEGVQKIQRLLANFQALQ